MNSDTGKWLMIAGAAILIAGMFIYFFHEQLQFLGKLPGDIRIERENFSFYFPITTMIILGLLATFVLHLIRKFL